MMTTYMERELSKYTNHEDPVKVWKVTSTSGTCRSCIFHQTHHDNWETIGYACNKRNLTANGWKLDELFAAQNFEDWRCDGDTRFSYRTGTLKVNSENKPRKKRNIEIMAMRDAGMTIKDIAKKMHIAQSTVHGIIWENTK